MIRNYKVPRRKASRAQPPATVQFNVSRCHEGDCRMVARGYHCKVCKTPVCREHQALDGLGNHGGLREMHDFWCEPYSWIKLLPSRRWDFEVSTR